MEHSGTATAALIKPDRQCPVNHGPGDALTRHQPAPAQCLHRSLAAVLQQASTLEPQLLHPVMRRCAARHHPSVHRTARPARRLKPTLSPSTQFGRRCLNARCTSLRNEWSPPRLWWVKSIGLDAAAHGTHTTRRTKAALICRRIKYLRAVPLLLGHTKPESTGSLP